MNTWNGLPYQYWKKVYDSIRAALNKLILQEKGENNNSEGPVDTRGMAYNKEAMAALLGEPTIEEPVIMAVEIPKASDVYFDANGDGMEEGNVNQWEGDNVGDGEGDKLTYEGEDNEEEQEDEDEDEDEEDEDDDENGLEDEGE